jgi:hypothetical protein
VFEEADAFARETRVAVVGPDRRGAALQVLEEEAEIDRDAAERRRERAEEDDFAAHAGALSCNKARAGSNHPPGGRVPRTAGRLAFHGLLCWRRRTTKRLC